MGLHEIKLPRSIAALAVRVELHRHLLPASLLHIKSRRAALSHSSCTPHSLVIQVAGFPFFTNPPRCVILPKIITFTCHALSRVCTFAALQPMAVASTHARQVPMSDTLSFRRAVPCAPVEQAHLDHNYQPRRFQTAPNPLSNSRAWMVYLYTATTN